ncbi:hypothetical protein ACIA8K_38215 [Catenuloplanes sp. NPDC051500]|uniref:hypothetical protein n=1 Tax=Catenuloplanes sp. NPDC051500 TaxID=3363959 RepID=UPI00378E5A2F
MTYLANADVLDGWGPAYGDPAEGGERLQIAPAPAGGLALRSSTESTGPALVLPERAVLEFVQAIREGAINTLLGLTASPHPIWCTREETSGEKHRSEVFPAALPGDDTEVRIGLVQSPDIDEEQLLISVEESDCDRKVLRLDGTLTARFITIVQETEYLAADSVPQLRDDGVLHPRWCAGGEGSREPHRSIPKFITADADLQSIWSYLVQPAFSPDGRPSAHTFASLSIREDGQTSGWLLGLHQLPLIRRALTEVTYLWAAVRDAAAT